METVQTKEAKCIEFVFKYANYYVHIMFNLEINKYERSKRTMKSARKCNNILSDVETVTYSIIHNHNNKEAIKMSLLRVKRKRQNFQHLLSPFNLSFVSVHYYFFLRCYVTIRHKICNCTCNYKWILSTPQQKNDKAKDKTLTLVHVLYLFFSSLINFCCNFHVLLYFV